MNHRYKFNFGELLGLVLLLLGLPGAAFGLGTFALDGAAFLGLSKWHWLAWIACSGVAAYVALLVRHWRPLIGVPLLVLVVIVAGTEDPMSALSAGHASNNLEETVQMVGQVAKYCAIVAPLLLGLAFGADGLAKRFSRARS